MTYYVLTPASNLGNILATESISPASLYPKRSHGFRSIALLDGQIRDFIQLYKTMPAKPTDDDDGGVMVLELNDALVGDVQGDEAGFFYAATTIHISPTKSRFVFFSQEELDAAFNSVQRSIEAKFADRYKARARIRQTTMPSLLDIAQNDPPKLSEMRAEAVDRFEWVDRLKGAIFGYCLGDDISLHKDLREDFVKYISAVDNLVNSATQVSSADMGCYRRVLESILYKFICNAEVENLRTACEEKFDLDERLDRIRRSVLVEPPLGVENDAFGLNMYRADLEERIRRAVWKKSRSEGRPTVVGTNNGLSLRLPAKNGALAERLVNYLVKSDLYEQSGKTLGYEFALQCGKMIKAFIGDSWDGSGEQSYINKLLPHLGKSSEFDPTDKSGIGDEKAFAALKALAYLCERNDNKDLDDFYRYLVVKCQVADFSLHFALWGATFGFSEMPKTLCDAMSANAESAARRIFQNALDAITQ